MSEKSKTGKNICSKVQKKSTPFKKPKKSGGSPSGVKPPPIFATKKIKKIGICMRCLRFLFADKIGRMSNIAAPVVPITDAKTVPIARIETLNLGLATRFPEM